MTDGSQKQTQRQKAHQAPTEASFRPMSHSLSPSPLQWLYTTSLPRRPTRKNMPVQPIATSKKNSRCRSARGAGSVTESRWAYLPADLSSEQSSIVKVPWRQAAVREVEGNISKKTEVNSPLRWQAEI